MSEKCTPEYNAETKRLMDELAILEDRARVVRRNAAREKQLNKQSAAYREKIRVGDVSRAPKKDSPEYDEGVTAALLERNRLKHQVDNLIAKGDRMGRSRTQKVLGVIHDLQMASILASLHVIEHLGWAVVGGHMMNIGADVTRSLVRHIPGIKGIAAQAPEYGRGVDIEAYKARLQGLLEAPREAKNQLLHGESSQESAFGKTSRMSDEFLTFSGSLSDALRTQGLLNKVAETGRTLASFVGRSHSAEKEFLTRPFFRESVVRQSRFLINKLQKEGHTPEEIKTIMDSEATKAAIGAKAMERAYYEKMQNKTAFTSSVVALIGTLNRSDSAGANFLGFLLETAFPIRKVPINVAIQASSLLAGAPKAIAAALRKGEMTPERADYIMRNIGQQGVGAALLAIGMIYYDKFGGVPGVWGKKDRPKRLDADGNPIEPGAAEGLDAAAFHGAPMAMMQVGASMASIFQRDFGRKHGIDFASDVVLRPTLNWYIRTIPYSDQFRRWKNTEELGRGRKEGFVSGVGQIAGDTARSILVPGFVQQAARAGDSYQGYRKPRNPIEDVKTGIPGLRETVPKR